MYDFSYFKDKDRLLKWAVAATKVSRSAKPYVGFNGVINYVHMAKDLLLLYQLRQDPKGALNVESLHMLLYGANKTLRKDIVHVDKFFKVDGEILWHSAIAFDGRIHMPFVVANAWQKESFEKYHNGGCFEMTFAGIGCYLEGYNQRGAIRFFNGNPVEMARKDYNDPSIQYADMEMSHMRSLNPVGDEHEPALVEFAGVVESCSASSCCGEKSYRIQLWSGPMNDSVSFPWTLVVTASHILDKYVPRVGDFVHGMAYLFGTFHGEACKEPTIREDHWETVEEDASKQNQCKAEPPDQIEYEPTPISVTSAPANPKKKDAETGEGIDWIWIPRKLDRYYPVPHHGRGLSSTVRKVLPKYVVYADYRKKIRGKLVQIAEPSRKVLRTVIDSIDYVITSADNRHMFGDVFDTIGIRQMTRDTKTGELHLWCCLGSAFGREHRRTILMIALDTEMNVLRYTLHMGDWNDRIQRGMETQVMFQSKQNKTLGLQFYTSLKEGISKIYTMREDDYFIASSLCHTSMVQAYCDGYDKKNGHRFTVEWQIHFLPWQFYIKDASLEETVAIFNEYNKYGVEAVQTMARWKWCKMKGNV